MARFNSTIPQGLADAFERGHVYLVDEDGRQLQRPLVELLGMVGRVWAHLRDSDDGEWYVQPLRRACELCQARYVNLVA